MNKDLPSIGHIIVSPKFAFGFYRDEKKLFVCADGITRERTEESFIPEEERVQIAAATGRIPPKKRSVELGAYDESRSTARFIVEHTHIGGGGINPGISGNDVYPDGWHVSARRLNEDGTYNPTGEVIKFYMTGCFNVMVAPKDIEIVGYMSLPKK